MLSTEMKSVVLKIESVLFAGDKIISEDIILILRVDIKEFIILLLW